MPLSPFLPAILEASLAGDHPLAESIADLAADASIPDAGEPLADDAMAEQARQRLRARMHRSLGWKHAGQDTPSPDVARFGDGTGVALAESQITDSLGRKECYDDTTGKHIACAGGEASAPAAKAPSQPQPARSVSHYKAKNAALPDSSRPPISSDERRAIRGFTDEDYDGMNEALRDGKDLGEHAAGHHHIAAAMAEAKPFEKPVTVYRGIGFRGDMGKQNAFLDSMKQAAESGGEVEFLGYQSSTTSRNVADNMGKPIRLVIDANHGIDVSGISQHSYEDELLLNHGSRFKVSKVSKGGRDDEHDWEVHLTQVSSGVKQ